MRQSIEKQQYDVRYCEKRSNYIKGEATNTLHN